MAIYSYDEIYKINAWQDNNVRCVLTQGEGMSSTSTDSNTYAKTIIFQLCDGRGAIPLPSSTTAVSLALKKSDGSEVLVSAFYNYTDSATIKTEDKTNGIVYFAITQSMTDIVGDVVGEIRLTTTTGIIKFYGIKFYVYKGVSDDAVIHSDDFNHLVNVLNKVEAVTVDGNTVVAPLDEVIAQGGLHPAASGVIYDYLHNNFVKFETISSSTLNNPNTHLDPQTIYRFGSQGIIIPATNNSNKETQYYFAEDGIMRYRYRVKSGDVWGAWVDDNNFYSIINQEDIGQLLSPQNKLDKYFVKTCIDKTKVRLTQKTRILGFGDSIMNRGYGGSWMDVVQERIGCNIPVNKSVGGAQFAVNSGSNTLASQLSSFHNSVNNNTLVDADNHAVDISEINLIVVAGGTNDAYNGILINNFKTAVESFFTNLKAEFTNRSLSCPPVLVITPIRRGKESEINAVGNKNLGNKIAKYSAVINNLALQSGFSVLNGFDIPVLVDDMTIKGVGLETATISSFMYKTADSGDAYDDILHVHPNPTSGRSTYAQAVINAIGCSTIGEKAVDTYELDDESVTNGKLASDAVTTNKVLNGNITEVKLSSEVQAKINKRTGIYSYTIPASNWSNNAQSLNLSSVYTVTNNTKVDTEGDSAVIEQLVIDDCGGIYVENNNGTLTIKVIGNTPTANITVQFVVYEVESLD